MRVKVDEDLPVAVGDVVRQKGHEATSVREQGMGGWKDPQLWPAVQAKGQLLITGDKGFADIRRYPPGSHHGVVLLRPEEDGIRPLLELCHRLFADGPLERFAGTITIVTPRRIRVRRSIGTPSGSEG
jgi:predicted nuclease of predicted toxin-antitoxin system